MVLSCSGQHRQEAFCPSIIAIPQRGKCRASFPASITSSPLLSPISSSKCSFAFDRSSFARGGSGITLANETIPDHRSSGIRIWNVVKIHRGRCARWPWKAFRRAWVRIDHSRWGASAPTALGRKLRVNSFLANHVRCAINQRLHSPVSGVGDRDTEKGGRERGSRRAQTTADAVGRMPFTTSTAEVVHGVSACRDASWGFGRRCVILAQAQIPPSHNLHPTKLLGSSSAILDR